MRDSQDIVAPAKAEVMDGDKVPEFLAPYQLCNRSLHLKMI